MGKGKQASLFKTETSCIDASSISNLFRHGGLPYPPYPRDIFEGLWVKLEELIQKGQIISHETVLKEIEKRDDEAKRWCYTHKGIFKNVDDCQIEKPPEIRTKYSKSHWEAEINRKGQEWADPWIIALAICEEAIIISDEVYKPDRIPYIANHFGIRTLNLMDFLREVGLKLRI